MHMHIYPYPGISTYQHRRISRGTHISQAHCSARKAILGPTPFNSHNPSNVFGTSPLSSPSLSSNFLAASWIYSVLRLQNPTLFIHSWTVSTDDSASDLAVRPPGKARWRLVTAADVTGSFVWDDSMSDIRIWKRKVWNDWLSLLLSVIRYAHTLGSASTVVLGLSQPLYCKRLPCLKQQYLHIIHRCDNPLSHSLN
jgi:hypothetical protein